MASNVSSAPANGSSKSSRVLLLFDFDGQSPGIGTVSSIKKPDVPVNVLERFQLLDKWMKEKTKIVIRWPHDHTSSWNLLEYNANNSTDCLFRTGTIVFMSDDKDAIVLKRNELVKMKKNHTTVIRGELSSQQSASPPAVLSVLNDNNKRQAEDKEVSELKAKISKLEDDLKLTKESLNACNDEKDELKEELEKLKSENPVLLAETLKENITQLKTLLTCGQQQATPGWQLGGPSGLVTPPSTPSTSLGRTKRMVPLDGTILMEFNVLRDAMASGREGNNKRCLNAMVGKIIDGFMDTEEQAKSSLTGKAARSLPEEQRTPKKKFPEELSTAIYNFCNTQWKKWYGDTLQLTKIQVNSAITDKLVGSHTSIRKKAMAKKCILPATGATAKSADDEEEYRALLDAALHKDATDDDAGMDADGASDEEQGP